MQRTTIRKAVSVEGIGVHTGATAKVTLTPGENGIAITRTDTRPQSFVLHPQAVQPSPLCTLLKNANGATLSTVEHLLSALHGMGITNLKIEVDGPEVPILDGSALPWVTLLEQSGLAPLGQPADVLAVREEVGIGDAERLLDAAPGPDFSVDCTVNYPHPKIGRQHWQGVLTPEVYKKEIAPARSFILETELFQARAAGFAKGASLESGVLFLNDGTVANPEGLRFPNEPVRHKVLDAVGDYFLAGKPVRGAFTLVRPGHASNNTLLRQLL